MKHTAFIPIFFLLFAFGSCSDDPPTKPLSRADSVEIYRKAFKSPETCKTCHPQHFAEWEASMHAYAFSDSIFFTLTRIGNERSNHALGNFCVPCHSPFAEYLGESGLERSKVSKIVGHGISCETCHKISTFTLGHSISSYRLDNVEQGSIADPEANAFHGSAYDERYPRSEICEGCHDVVNPLGFSAERTSTEWKNSFYPGRGITCQTCHMKTYNGPAAVGGKNRQVHYHSFTGVDIPLTDFVGKEQTIADVAYQLLIAIKQDVYAPKTISRDSIFGFSVSLNNQITGHNVPSGATFERQMWLEIVLKNSNGDTAYSSGLLDPNGDLLNKKSDFVQQGKLPLDTDLQLFGSTLYRNGVEIPFFWEANSMENRTIPPSETRLIPYSVGKKLPVGDYDLTVRLLFRSFPPYIFRAIGQGNLVKELIVFEMERSDLTFKVQ